jgi:hypothetical protein
LAAFGKGGLVLAVSVLSWGWTFLVPTDWVDVIDWLSGEALGVFFLAGLLGTVLGMRMLIRACFCDIASVKGYRHKMHRVWSHRPSPEELIKGEAYEINRIDPDGSGPTGKGST